MLPKSIQKNQRLFGAYMAGLIDGDGFIQIKNNSQHRIIPQGIIKIASNGPLMTIKALVEYHIGCKVHFEFDKRSKAVDTCFYISKKSINFIQEQIYPHIELPHKKERLKKYFRMKNEPARI